MGSLRWGILAPGGIAALFAQDLGSAGRTFLAVGSRSQERADQFAAKYGAARAYGSYEALVNDPDIEAVYIASPHSEHAAHAELALRHGKHVLVEKPFTLTGEQARRVRDVARETGLFAMEAMRTRFMPHTVRSHQLIEEGALGEIRALTADHCQRLDSDPVGRLWNPILGGGALLDLGIYNVSFASDYLGAPEHINAVATMTSTGVDLSTSMIFRYANGAIASLQTAMDARGPNRAAIIGEKARIEMGSVFYRSSRFKLFNGKDELIEDFSEPYPFWGKQYEAQEVERCIAAGLTESPRMSLDETVTIIETIDKVRQQINLTYPE
uniref:Gfo/Idh/MocA family protein n=1 Tax=Pararhizobium sp. IMCC3301 TaxID=3067904 RepID=UPI0027421C77|nr:Gfo/Idh/MocA family oxidoreductase [Pararhizobium sp. IMCC3301]